MNIEILQCLESDSNRYRFALVNDRQKQNDGRACNYAEKHGRYSDPFVSAKTFRISLRMVHLFDDYTYFNNRKINSGVIRNNCKSVAKYQPIGKHYKIENSYNYAANGSVSFEPALVLLRHCSSLGICC